MGRSVHRQALNHYCDHICPPALSSGNHRHHLCDRGEPDVSELTECAVQPHADDVPELPGHPQPQWQRGSWFSRRVPHVQSIPAPLLLHGPRGGQRGYSAFILFPIFCYSCLIYNSLCVFRRWRWCWGCWWCWPCPFLLTTPTRPAARFGATENLTSTGTCCQSGRRKGRMCRTG